MEEIAATFNGISATPFYSIRFNMEGETSDKESFLADLDQRCSKMSEGFSHGNIIDGGYDVKSMDGGLLFIGVFFGLIFYHLCGINHVLYANFRRHRRQAKL